MQIDIFHFLFKIIIHDLLSRPVHQRLPYISATSSARQGSQNRLSSKTHILNTDQLLIGRIFTSRLIPDLIKFDKFIPLRIVSGPYQKFSLYIER